MSKNNPAPVSGVIIINKHEGVTSHKIISSCRKLYNTRQVGHTGTLDPLATGVLPVLIGRAVKASDYLMQHDKEYTAELKLGIATDTEDITGTVLHQSRNIPPEREVLSACAGFVGKIMQIPPMYSAVKVEGRKLVDIAREGREVERKPREIEIYSLDAAKITDDTYRLNIKCSKGTYIRTLCADIGSRLGCGGVMASLVRNKSGIFTLDDAVTVEQLDNMTEEERLALPRPVESLFMNLECVNLIDYYAKLIRSGANVFQKKLKIDLPEGNLVRIHNKGEFIALGKSAVIDDAKVIRLEKLFVL